MNLGALAAAVLLVGLVAGCSGEEAPTTLPTVGPTVDDLPSEKAFLAIPPEARPDTEPAAAAFTRFFFEQVNESYLAREPERIAELSEPECGSCAQLMADIDRLREAGHTVTGSRYVVSASEASPAAPNGETVVDFRFDGDAYVELDASNTEVASYPATTSVDGQVIVVRRGDGWSMSAIRTVKP